MVKTKNEWSGRTLHDLYGEAMTPWECAELKACAESMGLLCFSTPFDATAVEFLENLDVPAHKVASFELNDLPLIERVARTGKPVILSTGMATLGEIEAALTTCRGAGNEKLALLRCVSCYPAKPESMALASFGLLGQLGIVVGLSDHTRDATVAIASVALGAKIIEKHFILDRSVGGPDAFFSLLPQEFHAMTLGVRVAEAALGTPRFGPSAEGCPAPPFGDRFSCRGGCSRSSAHATMSEAYDRRTVSLRDICRRSWGGRRPEHCSRPLLSPGTWWDPRLRFGSRCALLRRTTWIRL